MVDKRRDFSILNFPNHPRLNSITAEPGYMDGGVLYIESQSVEDGNSK